MRDKAGGRSTVQGMSAGPDAMPDSPLADARAALTALGYKPAEVQRYTESVYKDGMRTEQIIQEALKRAVR
jgi:holliday junction DNA helicase RuvA